MLKQGEINAILNNLVKDAKGNVRVGKNSIFLNKTDDILLRTNGIVVYGEYIVDATKRIEFTFDPARYTQPYIGSGIQNIDGKRSFFRVNYAEYKETILTAFRLAFNEEANTRLKEMRKVITEAMKTKNTQPVIKEEIKTETKIEEVKEMNKELNVMAMAHKIRVGLSLEGDYRVQMKIALTYAWEVKRGELSLEELLNIESTTVAADTYNATPVEEEVAVDKEPVLPTGQTIYLKSFVNGTAIFNRLVNGQDVPFTKLKARNLRDVDKQFATKLESLINVAPQGTTIKSYGDYTSLTFTNTPGLKALADSKGIVVESGVAPSGVVA